MIKFPSIDQYRNAVRAVSERIRYSGKNGEGESIFDTSRLLPTLAFCGTVKLHGTNAGIVRSADGQVHFQSRERILTRDQDNAGFMSAMESEPVEALFTRIAAAPDVPVAIFGEWCGQGIQRGVAISELPKRFVIFALQVGGEWVSLDGLNVNDISPLFHNVHSFPKWSIDIDFNNPALSQNRLVELTEAVEAECPVGKAFGVSGVGEGIVWRCVNDGFRDIVFKVKGEKHAASKVKTLAPVDVERVTAVNDFVASVTTESRLEQGVHVLQTELLKPFAMSSMGDFIRWVFNDIIKEEADTMDANGIGQKDIGSAVSDVCRRWFVARLNAEIAA